MVSILHPRENKELYERYKVVNTLFCYLVDEINTYFKLINVDFTKVNDDIIYYATMIVYLSKQCDTVYKEWKQLRKEMFYEEGKN